jgi:hypothetical protein
MKIIILGLILAIILVIYLISLIKYRERFTNVNKKIAFCFLIYDKINNEELWYNFFKNIDKNKYNIYIHYKENKLLKYFESHKIKDIISTKWCGKSLVEAQNKLLESAIKDSNNQHFIFISNSCIPLKSFDHIYNIFDTKYSYFNKTNSYTKSFTSNIKAYKSSQWCILNRKHTLKILENNDILTEILLHWDKSNPNYYFIRGCPDEYTYISLLYHLGLEKELILTETLSSDATTFAGWKYMTNYKNFSKSEKKGQPNNYSYICKEELDYLIKSKSLFGRKFIDDCGGLEHLNIISE